MATVKERETELAAAREAEKAAQAAWMAQLKKVRAAEARVDEARQAGERIDAFNRDLDKANQEVDQIKLSLEAKEEQLAKKVDPLPPDAGDVRIEPGTNVRPTYSLIAVGGIAALFTVLILFSVRSDRSAAAAAAARSAGEEGRGELTARLFPGGDPAAAAANGNGHTESHEKPDRREDKARVHV